MVENRGKLITFEGGEGTGKSTQVKLLKERLQEKGHEVITTREPGGTPNAEYIRNLFVQDLARPWQPETEILLTYAARKEHVETLIKPKLDEGCIILCDRFYDSTAAYQGYGAGVSLAYIEAIRKQVIPGFKPDATFILDLPVEVGLGRAKDRNRFEAMGKKYHNRVREGFLKIAEENPERCHLIDATQSMMDVCREVESLIMEVLEK